MKNPNEVEYTDEQLDEMYAKHLEQQEYERMVNLGIKMSLKRSCNG